MNEQELRDLLKTGVKSPSIDFTDKVMSDISFLPETVPVYEKRKVRILMVACCILVVVSVFVRIPEIEFFDLTIEFSPVIIPILTLVFLFFIFQQLYDLSDRLIETKDESMDKPMA